MKAFSKPVSAIAFSANSEFILACSVDKSIKLCKIKPSSIVHNFTGHTDTITSCVFSHSQPMAITASTDRTVRTWDYQKGISLGTFVSTSSIYGVDISVTDSVIVTGHRNGGIRIWSVKSQSVIKEVAELHDEAITSVNYMPDGN